MTKEEIQSGVEVEVMKAYLDNKKIECITISNLAYLDPKWHPMHEFKYFDFTHYKYRIKKEK